MVLNLLVEKVKENHRVPFCLIGLHHLLWVLGPVVGQQTQQGPSRLLAWRHSRATGDADT